MGGKILDKKVGFLYNKGYKILSKDRGAVFISNIYKGPPPRWCGWERENRRSFSICARQWEAGPSGENPPCLSSGMPVERYHTCWAKAMPHPIIVSLRRFFNRFFDFETSIAGKIVIIIFLPFLWDMLK